MDLAATLNSLVGFAIQALPVVAILGTVHVLPLTAVNGRRRGPLQFPRLAADRRDEYAETRPVPAVVAEPLLGPPRRVPAANGFDREAA